MSGWFARCGAVALAAGALAIAGCGSSSSSATSRGSTGTGGGSGATLSPKAWQSQMTSISNQLSAGFAPVRTQGRNPNTWFTLANKLKQINAKLQALNPPSAASGVNSAIVSGLQPLPSEATAIGNDLKSGNTQSARADGLRIEHSLLSLLGKISNALSKVRSAG